MSFSSAGNRRDELLGLTPGNATSATWTIDCVPVPTASGFDLRGPYIQGPAGESAAANISSIIQRSPPGARTLSAGTERLLVTGIRSGDETIERHRQGNQHYAHPGLLVVNVPDLRIGASSHERHRSGLVHSGKARELAYPKA